MGAIKDRKGLKFNYFTIIEDSGKRDCDGNVLWKCKCKCGNLRNNSYKALNTGNSKSCGCLKKDQSKELFFTKFKKTDGCWNWEGQISKLGYGSQGKNKNQSHRMAWKFEYGEIPKGMYVCHKCDNRICVNPEHLFLGTIRDNLKDMFGKGRNIKGCQVQSAKLNENKVKEIKLSLKEGENSLSLSKKYTVHPRTIRDIKNNITWKHVLI